LSIEVMNITGETIYRSAFSDLQTCPFGSERQIDLSNQPKGIYFFKLITNNNHFSEKIIVQ